MEELDSGSHTVIENVALLLRTGRFSDLTFTCRQQQFFVHRAIVCARSPVWAAAAEGSFKEAETKIVDVDIADSSTLQRALEYLYTGFYDDKSLTSIDRVGLQASGTKITLDGEVTAIESRESSESNLDSRELTNESEDIEIRDASLQHETQPTQADSEDLVHGDNLNTTIQVDVQDCGCHTQSEGESNRFCNNAKLSVNTLVYILADYYQIPELKRLALQKFAAALDQVCRKGLSDVCHLVYESAPSTAADLRSCLSDAIARSGQQLTEDASFMATALVLPELLRDVFLDLVRQNQIASNQRDAAVAASLRAEDEAKKANKKGQDDKQQIIEQVNRARRCRHCTLENNVVFEREGSCLGRIDYSFRCRCRTRY